MIRYNDEGILNLKNVLSLEFSKNNICIEYTNKSVDCFSNNTNEKFVDIKKVSKKILKKICKGNWLQLRNKTNITFVNLDNVSEFYISNNENNTKKIEIYANETIYYEHTVICYKNFDISKFIMFRKNNKDVFLNIDRICDINQGISTITIYFVDHISEFSNVQEIINQLFYKKYLDK